MRWEPAFHYASKTTFLLATLREVTIVAQIPPTEFSPRQTNSKNRIRTGNYFIRQALANCSSVAVSSSVLSTLT